MHSTDAEAEKRHRMVEAGSDQPASAEGGEGRMGSDGGEEEKRRGRKG